MEGKVGNASTVHESQRAKRLAAVLETAGMGVIDSIKRDFAKHRRKAAVLGVLSVIMAVLMVKAAFELRPRNAAASAVVTKGSNPAEAENEETAADAEARIKQSRELWKILREKRGIPADVAFTFDPSYFPIDPTKVQAPVEHVVDQTPRPAVNTEELARAARVNAIREEARSLIVHSTVVGSGGTKPVAVINKYVLTVGDRISGFEITAIRAREVEFKKDGVTLAIKMADDASVQ